jgi:hypothetical protein
MENCWVLCCVLQPSASSSSQAATALLLPWVAAVPWAAGAALACRPVPPRVVLLSEATLQRLCLFAPEDNSWSLTKPELAYVVNPKLLNLLKWLRSQNQETSHNTQLSPAGNFIHMHILIINSL